MNTLPPSELTLEKALGALDLDDIARESGWSLRRDSKLAPLPWCVAFCLASANASASLRIAAFLSGLKSGLTLTGQAVNDRLGRGGAKLMESILAKALALKAGAGPAPENGFRRVVIQDSTCLALPKALAEAFPGPSNKFGSSATMRIQGYFDMNAGRFLSLKLGSFRQNDQSGSGQAALVASKGDLLLRDLGYFSLSAFRKLAGQGIALLTRLRLDVLLFEGASREPVDLLRLLRDRGSVDMAILAGGSERMPMRLVAFPVPQSVADGRRRKIRQDRDWRRKPSKRLMALQGWQLFLTTATAETLPRDSIGQLYAMRWHIETLFKSWKSSLGVGRMHSRVSENMVRALVCGALIRTTLAQAALLSIGQGGEASPLSSIKLASLVGYAQLGTELEGVSQRIWQDNIRKHSLYGKRRRRNMMQHWEELESLFE